jgi:hypothetical protein
MNLLLHLQTSPVREALVPTENVWQWVFTWGLAATSVAALCLFLSESNKTLSRISVVAFIIAFATLVLGGVGAGISTGNAEDANRETAKAYVSDVSQWLALDFDIDVSTDSAESLLDGKPLTVTVDGMDKQMMLVPRDNGELTVVIDGATVLAPHK